MRWLETIEAYEHKTAISCFDQIYCWTKKIEKGKNSKKSPKSTDKKIFQ